MRSCNIQAGLERVVWQDSLGAKHLQIPAKKITAALNPS